MNKRTKGWIAACMTVSILATQFISTKNVLAESNTLRFCGISRYETAVSVSKGNWSTSDYAVLARGDQFPDALCAGPLAKAYNAPILLTETNQLTSCVAAELKRLNVKTVFIVGGTGAVSQAVENSVKALNNISVKRLAGNSRFGTSKAIANEVKSKLGTINKVVVAYGFNYPDALSVSAIAGSMGMPIVLSETNQLPDETLSFVNDNKSCQYYVVGGTGVIGDRVKGLLPSAKRLAGTDRYATSVAIMKEFESNIDFSKVYTAVGNGPNGNEFADALSGSAAAAMTKSPLILTYKTLDPSIEAYLSDKLQENTVIVALGGTAAVPDSVVSKIATLRKVNMIKSISLIDSNTGKKADAVINGKDGIITFDITNSGITTFNTGSAVITVDLASANIKTDKINKTVTNISKTDNFANVVFAAMKDLGYNPDNGILASNVKTLLNGSVLTLTDKAGKVQVFTIVMK